eukprot:CAMPEP_0175761340 /NCGR_PEP_ID=MMETSP0097-20121207/66603_1 /TAXON_ID=311494 /ORGANISM="Alexandrium monilatum, Strain CCMP3105" /LENGTH=56 /DNA_ID=CAMNT_0017070899 /DNA_START=93 /DNA_END=259 /DNA_ORIENTATION=+
MPSARKPSSNRASCSLSAVGGGASAGPALGGSGSALGVSDPSDRQSSTAKPQCHRR